MKVLRPHWPLLPLLLLAAGLRLVFFTGLLASDDTAYASNAIALHDGSFSLGDMTTMRVALNAAAAVSFALLGMSEFSLGVPALIASLLTLPVVYAIAHLLGGRNAAVIAGLLYALSPLNILNSSSLLPEVPMGFCVALAFLLFLLGFRTSAVGKAFALGLLSGAAIGLGYLVKEPAALVVGAFALGGLIKLAQGDRSAWLYALPVCGFAAIFAAETAVHFALTGELLHRFRGIALYQGEAVLRSEQERRLQSFWLYPRNMFLVLNQVGLLFYLLVSVGVIALLRRWQTPLLVVLWLLIPFLYLEFGSTSLTSYNPLPKQPRYLDPLTAPATILLGLWLTQYLRSRNARAAGLAWGLLGLYAITSPAFTAISFIDRQASIQPIRVLGNFLAQSQLEPVFATSIIANGLSFRSGFSSTSGVSRACSACIAGPCTTPTPHLLGEVWAIPPTGDRSTVPPATACSRWRHQADVPVDLPPIHRSAVRLILGLADHLRLPHAAGRQLQPLRNLLEIRRVVVYTSLEVR